MAVTAAVAFSVKHLTNIPTSKNGSFRFFRFFLFRKMKTSSRHVSFSSSVASSSSHACALTSLSTSYSIPPICRIAPGLSAARPRTGRPSTVTKTPRRRFSSPRFKSFSSKTPRSSRSIFDAIFENLGTPKPPPSCPARLRVPSRPRRSALRAGTRREISKRAPAGHPENPPAHSARERRDGEKRRKPRKSGRAGSAPRPPPSTPRAGGFFCVCGKEGQGYRGATKRPPPAYSKKKKTEGKKHAKTRVGVFASRPRQPCSALRPGPERSVVPHGVAYSPCPRAWFCPRAARTDCRHPARTGVQHLEPPAVGLAQVRYHRGLRCGGACVRGDGCSRGERPYPTRCCRTRPRTPGCPGVPRWTHARCVRRGAGPRARHGACMRVAVNA